MNVNRKITALAAGLLALSMVAGVHVALAQEKSSAINIAVVDVEFLRKNSDAAKNLRTQIEKIGANNQQEIEDKQDEIYKLNESIERERPRLSEDAYHQRMRQLLQKVANHESDAQERESNLDGAVRGASQKISAAIEQVVDEIKEQRNFALVLPRSIIIGSPAVPDITLVVLRRLNQRIPYVAVDLPK